jgi:putative hydrolase of the HAD superfamily
MNNTAIKTLFLDVGGVLGTNGWDHHIRRKVIESFGIDFATIDARHPSIFEIYETGKITLDEYLNWVIFFEKRSFSKQEFIARMFDESQPNSQMIDFFQKIKEKHQLKIVLISNEGRELAEYRIQKFGLRQLADTLIFSGFVKARKPDQMLYHLALDLSNTKPPEALYVDDRPLLIEMGKSLGIKGIVHQTLEKTAAAFADHGLVLGC